MMMAGKIGSATAVAHRRGCFQRGIHSKNKKAMEFVAEGWNALKEVDRVIDFIDANDPRLFPHFRIAKGNFELALEVDNSNTHARYWLARFHLKYQALGSCKAIINMYNLINKHFVIERRLLTSCIQVPYIF